MPYADLNQRQRRALRALLALAAERGEDARQRSEAYRAEVHAAQRAETAQREAIDERCRSELAALDREKSARLSQIEAQFESQTSQLERDAEAQLERLTHEIESSERRAQQAIDEARWLASSVYEAARRRLKTQLRAVREELQTALNRARATRKAGDDLRTGLGFLPLDAPVQAEPSAEKPAQPSPSPGETVLTGLAEAQQSVESLAALSLPRYTRGISVLGIYLAVFGMVAPPAGMLAQWRGAAWWGIAAVLSAVLGTIAFWLLRRAARHATDALTAQLHTAVARVESGARQHLAMQIVASRRQTAELRQTRGVEYRRAADQHGPALGAARLRREIDLPRIVADREERLAGLRQNRDESLAVLERDISRRCDAVRTQQKQLISSAESLTSVGRARREAAHVQARESSLTQWQSAMLALRGELAAVRRQAAEICPPWPALLAREMAATSDEVKSLSIGTLAVDLSETLGTLSPEDQGPVQLTAPLVLPALVDFPGARSICIAVEEGGHERARELMHVLMLRLLTSLPPGKVRFTIVDPQGLGQHFASFMHLADYDEALVSHRIWTEPSHIEKRLVDLTEHMETMIQKYLRDEFRDITQYNAMAGEIAEPFRVLVVDGFPRGFTESALARLLSIAESGPRCGVHLMFSADARTLDAARLTSGDLDRRAIVFRATSERLLWRDSDYEPLPLVIDAPASSAHKALLAQVGKGAVASRRVEVPFAAVAPPADEIWASDSRGGIDVPLGRAGATRLLHLRLGQGTSQHVVIAGKTGSGKSTLLHALVTNAALRYSPEELELYLVDFKKGVEFKTYAAHRLAHARVVAVESEREFGLSVLERLDRELRIRGERFRDAGVQDLPAWRASGRELPRVLLVIDEFQEFFVQDDRLAQEAALLLDRLVRQGRAFGVHVILGSQTLGGAYALARSTLGQMAVRVALESSEHDAHLVLSEDNSAARLLSRPGEAIYNDAGGLIEGNHPFQVVWLSEATREQYLEQIAARDAASGTVRQPQIVFEGSRPADIEHSPAIAEAPTNSHSPHEPTRLWLGDPVSIGPETHVELRPRGGANLLILGQNEVAAAGMLLAANVCAAAARSGQQESQLRVWWCDAAPENPLAAHFEAFHRALAGCQRITNEPQLLAALEEFTAEIARRSEQGTSAPRWWFTLFDLARFRSLRRREDEFSFSRSEAPLRQRADRLFANLLADGPPVGIHTLLWCDTLANFNRTLDRSAMREFEHRVLLQMSAQDSSLLIDTPAASQLGNVRALLAGEDAGKLEKFRPFAPPSIAWLRETLRRISQAPIDQPSLSIDSPSSSSPRPTTGTL